MGEPDPDDDVQMNFLATQSQREKWEEYADEAGFRNLSGFFRYAIEQEVNGDPSDGGSVPDDLTQQLSEVVEGLNRVEARLQDLDDRMAGIEREVREDPAIKELANDVFGVLPTREEVVEYARTVQEAGTAPPNTSNATAGTVEGIATTLDEDEYRVSTALDKLQADTTQVQTLVLAEEIHGWEEFAEGGDEPRYYKMA
jgi:hypothetical protein